MRDKIKKNHRRNLYTKPCCNLRHYAFWERWILQYRLHYIIQCICDCPILHLQWSVTATIYNERKAFYLQWTWFLNVCVLEFIFVLLSPSTTTLLFRVQYRSTCLYRSCLFSWAISNGVVTIQGLKLHTTWLETKPFAGPLCGSYGRASHVCRCLTSPIVHLHQTVRLCCDEWFV
jgi:hypothetical protein